MIPGGTNNIAEFLAIVHALALTPNETTPVYSDSQTARCWVYKGYCRMESIRNDELRQIAVRANTWLRENPLQKKRVQTWQTKHWGENPADFGRKN
jgi:ribonuclease HI